MPAADSSNGGDPALFVVGVGASAGGLEALQRLFASVRRTGRLTFVVVQHLSPDFKSLMDELLAPHTELSVHRAESGMKVEPDSIYLLPPKKEITISGGVLALRDRDPEQGLSLPIDVFFTSLASDAGARAIAVVLSGTGTDGSRGVRAVHEAGGLVVVQSEASAKFDGMPRCAIDTGLADLVLPPEGLGAALARLADRGERLDLEERDGGPDQDEMERALELLRNECGIDFSGYKATTVMRRIERRALLGDARDVSKYVAQLERDPAEVRALYRDLLIGVTRFFRDPDAFDRLRRDVLPLLLDRLPAGEELRIWVPGCATGEEAYSLGILALEAYRAHGRPAALKVFASDVHRGSLEVAGQGSYPLEALANLPLHLRERYFTGDGERVHVSKELRSCVVFAHHNVLRDAPFTRLDLVSCRNVLIYFKPGPQRKVLATFHFALKTGGVLFLGPSEAPGALSEELAVVDPRWKIFRKRRDVRLPRGDLPVTPPPGEGRRGLLLSAADDEPRLRRAREALVQRFAPPTLVVDDEFNLLHAFNGAGRYLSQRDGRPSLNVLDLLGDELKFVVGAALRRVTTQRDPIIYTGVAVGRGAAEERVTVTVSCVDPARGGEAFLVSIERERGRGAPAPSGVLHADPGDPARERIVVPPPVARACAVAARDGVEPRRRLRVAIVEDDDDIRDTMREILELEGHRVVEAANGVDGAALVVAEQPDVAFVDVGLPGVDGYALARRVREALGPAVRLVALTGYGRPEDRAAAAEAGFDAYAVKPLESDRLLALLEADPDQPGAAPVGAAAQEPHPSA
jgi:two-component system CheB/CheR fusion protein